MEPTAGKAIVLFDGVCVYCNSVVNFLIRNDKKKIFLFLPLQSEKAKNIFTPINPQPDSIVLQWQGTLYEKSKAVFKIMELLGGGFKVLLIFRIIPASLADFAYSLFARYRYKIFGKLSECRMPEPELRDRFL